MREKILAILLVLAGFALLFGPSLRAQACIQIHIQTRVQITADPLIRRAS